jgi:superfamily II DNA/RNA helicase
MNTHFFTNKKDNTLLKKFEGIFEHVDIKKFDALVGYLRASGYFRVRKFIDDVEEVRILVGIDVDHLISEAARKGLEFNFNTNVTRSEFLAEVRRDIENADYSKKVEDGIIQFVKDVVDKKVQIKAHPSKTLHSKIYIFRPENYNEHNSGFVITGSSNMTAAGMEKNFEFNVQLDRFGDVEFARETFQELWEEGIDILPKSIEDLTKKTFLNDSFTPFEIYIKFLMEYFGQSIEYDPESITDLPRGYKKLHYQVDAVNDGYNKLMHHNGFILADVVGLGKTIVASIIAKKFYFSNGYRTKILVIYPPALENNWRETIRDFEVPNVDFITNGSLHKIRYPEDYDLIIVDEAHKFRSDEAQMFTELQKLCKTPRKRPATDGSREKKVILVTATPLNNKPQDIRNLLYLFQDAKDSSLEVKNLQSFFRPLIDEYKKLKKERDNEKIKREVKKIYEIIRNKILEPIIVRRTRTDIMKTEEYRKDMAEQGMTFPDIKPPKPILYQLDPTLNKLYDETMQLLKFTDTGLKYYRYQAIRFLPKEAQEKFFNNQAEVISDQLAILMKSLLVKRLDSSFYAFHKSLERYKRNNSAMLKMLDSGKVYIAPKLDIADYILNQNDKTEDELEEMLNDPKDETDILVFEIDDFDDRYLPGVQNDQEILDELTKRWNKVDYDPKLETFLEELKSTFLHSDINDQRKLVVFSESKETIDYLSEELEDHGIKKVLTVNGENQKSRAPLIRENFDANIPISEQKDDYNIAITTEVLAEGVNLHRSNVIVNYDIPWNATKLMQRIGRVNRIGTQSDYIHIFNFYPTQEADSEIDLNQKAFIKLQAFHTALGEDSQIYSSEEEFDSFGLFEKVPEEERDERLIYLNRLRRFRDEDPDLYNKIRSSVPLRARTGRRDKTRKLSTLTYLKNEKRDAFYYIDSKGELEELTFIEAARLFEAKVTEKGTQLHDQHHDQVSSAVVSFKTGLQKRALETSSGNKLGPNEKKAIGILKMQSNTEFSSEEDKKLLKKGREAIAVGKFQKLPREVNKLFKKVKDLKASEFHQHLIKILESYPIMENGTGSEFDTGIELKAQSPLEPKIIISESFTV